jgi:DNA-binding PadR family transcriptional regulator
MEFFVLASIERAQANTLYAMHQRAGLQSGGVRPALKTLQQDGLLLRAKTGQRRRREFRLTESGRSFLAQNWPSCLHHHVDIESVLRSAAVAELMGDVSASTQLLDRTAYLRHQAAAEREIPEVLDTTSDPLSNYRFMRALCERQRLEAEANALSAIVQMRLDKAKQ